MLLLYVYSYWRSDLFLWIFILEKNLITITFHTGEPLWCGYSYWGSWATYRSWEWVWLWIKGSLVRALVQPQTFVEIYHEIISMVILPFPLIQEGQMSVSGESMCTKSLLYWREIIFVSMWLFILEKKLGLDNLHYLYERIWITYKNKLFCREKTMVNLWPWKLGKSHQNLISFDPVPIIWQIW